MTPLLDPHTADVLARGGRVVAASMRAARALRRAYAEDARSRGEQSWPVPRISDWSGWIASLYEALSREGPQRLPQPISALQEQSLWRRVQREDAARVVSPGRLAALAAEAYSLLGSYDAHESRRAPWAAEAGEDAEHFLQWAEIFESECARLEVISRSQLEARVRAHADVLIASQQVEQELLLVGFDRLTPSRTRLLEALAAAGIAWQQALHAGPSEPTPQTQLISATSLGTEIAACAQWVRTRLLDQPRIRIGVLAPQLAVLRAEIERGFRRALLPADDWGHQPVRDPQSALYEFSLGDPLSAMPNIAAALLLLQWLTRPLAAAEVSSLLVGGFLASSEAEAAQLAQADALLRKRGLLRSEISLHSLLQESARCGDLLPAPVHARLQNGFAWAPREDSARRAYSEWADQVPTVLTMLGWPGIAERGSIPFQAEQRWSSLIDETAQLAFTGERGAWGVYIADLHNAASSTLFAAESADAPVQIVGISEASGQTFDALWVLGMTEDNWPPRGRPHPLLPPWLQREHGMPHASPHIDLALAEEQLRRVQTSAPRVVWSYSLQAGGFEQRPSPMLSMVVSDLDGEREPTPGAERGEAPAPATVSVTDTLTGMAWATEQSAGGSEVLKRQAACGFQGFARGRLAVAPLEPEAWGLSAAERGTLLHRALEKLWSTTPVEPGSPQLHSQQDLMRAIEDDQITAYVQAAVAAALQPLLRRASSTDAPDRWMHSILTLEAERLSRRLLFWLEQESYRAPFRVVAVEKDVKDARIGELHLHLRLDRADAVADNRLVLLDYKTAEQVSVKQWQGERPEEPQLPIYALYGQLGRDLGGGFADTPGEVAALAFAQIRAGDGKTALLGLAENPAEQLGAAFSTPEGKPPRHVLSTQMRAEWDTALRGLAAAFVRGDAPVNPKNGEKTCRTCNLFALCRIRSQTHSTL